MKYYNFYVDGERFTYQGKTLAEAREKFEKRDEEVEETPELDIDSMTKAEIVEALESRGVDFDQSDKKAELQELLEKSQ